MVFPFIILLKKPGFAPFSWNEMVISIVLMAFVLLGLYFWRSTNRHYSVLILLLAALFFYQSVLAILAEDSLTSFISILLHDKYLLLVFAVPVIFTQQGIRYSIFFTVIVAGAVIWLPLIGYLQNPASFSLLLSGSTVIRESSIFPNSNMYAVYLVVVLFLSLPILENVKTPSRILLIVLILLPAALSILITFSRRTWVALLVGMILYCVFKTGSKKWYVIGTCFTGFSAFLTLDLGRVFARFLLIFDSGFESNSLRISSSSHQIQALLQRPETAVGGIGVGTVGPASSFGSKSMWPQIDSYYVQFALEFGLIGLFLYISIFFVVLSGGRYRLQKPGNSPAQHNQLLAILIILGILYFVAIVGSTPITFPLNLLHWFLIGTVFLNEKNKLL